jgi:hypothetical protein
MTIVFPGPTAWNAANWIVRGFFDDARPYLAGEAPALVPAMLRSYDTELHLLDLETAPTDQLAQLHRLVERVIAEHAVPADPASAALYDAKLRELRRLAARAAGHDVARTVGRGRIVVGDTIDAGIGTGYYRGHVAGRPGDRRLVTVSGPHAEPHAVLVAHLALPVVGIAPLELVSTVDDPEDGWRGDCMVEVAPEGAPALALAPLPEPAAVRIALRVAEIAAGAHGAGLVVNGIRPDLVYVTGDRVHPEVTALAPRGPRFIHEARAASSGLGALAALYDRETMLGLPPTAASDVFALCATVFQLVTGQHPFGEHPGEQLSRMAADAPLDWPGSPALGALLRRGFSPDPAARPTVAELAAALATLR